MRVNEAQTNFCLSSLPWFLASITMRAPVNRCSSDIFLNQPRITELCSKCTRETLGIPPHKDIIVSSMGSLRETFSCVGKSSAAEQRHGGANAMFNCFHIYQCPSHLGHITKLYPNC
ncbi:hypothetical protein, unlikely [Trypanosoma brucei gambiense DAL972]|uniref:Uncharacterized protein n=1 Tax=Trypanosoma brucei gambiense (strain MHOM/CI/86/DAL972) TaxID=679716 RepID=C9ZYB9_TRYB9|nr:hypothetical protein, unlikely [Trypanosoma brucei gambiense DAL972]CBH14418.1 hypothetical protein, unlikely [Trypanosoma brucei gambiense DAL972]|eukprot:XP_011776684.1 hypothetical protein, unlikely [Trypanosoma brucei gambiense DAL972]